MTPTPSCDPRANWTRGLKRSVWATGREDATTTPRAGFGYNTARYLAAAFPPMLMGLNQLLIQHNVADPFRKAATVLSLILVLGLVALVWAPGTKGKPLPED